MKKVLFTIVFAMLVSNVYAFPYDLKWPETKFEIGDCITPIDTTWSWYGKTAVIEDIVLSQFLEAFAYELHIYNINRAYYSKFAIVSIDNYTVKVSPCPA